MTALIMQVVAHEDDDLLFMNPDVAETIAAGIPSVTVYVTAGNITGTGTTDGERARNRQRGIQDAYAHMAGLATIAPGQADWQGDLLSVAGKQIERYTLAANSDVQLVFLNLHDGKLSSFYSGATDTTVIPDSGIVTKSFSYTHANVVAVLGGLMSLLQPTILRFQDFDPDTRYTPVEHPDHHAAMEFATEASSGYDPSLIQLSYRSYEIGSMPVNLAPAIVADKNATISLYAAYDDLFDGLDWAPRMYNRWSHRTFWAGYNADGRVQIFVVRNGVVYTHWQTTSGGWAGPVTLGGAGGPLAPTIAVGNNADGRLEIFGRRKSDHMIVHTWQTKANGSWYGNWASLGSPNAGLSNVSQVGIPIVTSNADGRLQVFVKNGGGGVSTIYQKVVNGTWSGWVDLRGSDVQEGVAATNPVGEIELFAPTTTGILHWWQPGPNQGLVMSTLGGAVPASPLNAAPSADGSILLACRRADAADVIVVRQARPGGLWNTPRVVLQGQTGVGEVAMIRAGEPGSPLLFLVARNDDGTLSVAAQQEPDGDVGSWSALDGPVIDCPAVAVDGTGAILLFGIGMDGVAYWRQQTSLTDTAFGPWQALP